MTREPPDSLISSLLPVTQSLVKAALGGDSHADLVALLGNALTAAGLDISAIEVACDAVDPERAQHFVRWRRASGAAPVIREGATDAVAFATHLAPDATLGFFDDVMSLFATERPGGFSASEIDFLHLATPVFALALGARLNAAAARVLLRTYLGRDAATALLGGRVGLGEVEKIRVVVIYCDLFGFTPLTEMLDAQSLIKTLNLFFETVTRPASRAGGQVSGHVGDAVVMYFPIHDAQSEPRVCAAAVKAALEGLKALDLLSAMQPRRLQARVGIDIGDVVHGNIGSAGRFSFTIIGAPVNRAARLQALAKDLGAVMLMTSDLAKAAGVQCRPFGKHALRGFDQPVDIVGFGAADGVSPQKLEP